MRAYLAAAPVWMATAFQAVFFGISMLLWNVLGDHDGWKHALIGAAIGTAVFVPFAWFGFRLGSREEEEIVRPITRAQRRVVMDAAATGKPPDDPALTAAAVEVARCRLRRDERYKTACAVVFALFAGLFAIGFVADRSAWYFIVSAAFFVALIISTLRSPSAHRRRIARLEAGRV
jgi:MFS family permease